MEKHKFLEREKISCNIARVLAVTMLGMNLVACGGKVEEKITSTGVLAITQPNIIQTTPILTETELTYSTTDWKVCGKANPGEGVVAVLRRVSGNEPHQWSKTMDQKVEIKRANGRVEVYSWEELLKLNPFVSPGDEVCDSIKGVLSLTATPLPGDIHK